MDLHLDPDELNTCVACGLCLPHCPTYRVSGDESMSPRGRIGLMREVQNGAPLTDEVVRSFETCVQCRGCEPACPSGVPYGHLMERTRESLADAQTVRRFRARLALKPLEHPNLLRAGSSALALTQRAGLLPARLGVGTALPLTRQPLSATGDDVYLFTGCVMDAWQRDVHRAAQRVLTAAGIGSIPTEGLAACCGALHTHAGLGNDARHLASAVMGNLDPDIPILVDSAGCGAAMKDYGRLVGTEEASEFSERVYDIGEWLAMHLTDLPAAERLDLRVAIQDPCHLRHVQRVHHSTRVILRPYVRELIELDDDGLCCGAGGAFSVLQPQLAGDIRERKLAAISRADPDVVASANPGCSMYLAAAGVPAVHPMELIDRALQAGDG